MTWRNSMIVQIRILRNLHISWESCLGTKSWKIFIIFIIVSPSLIVQSNKPHTDIDSHWWWIIFLYSFQLLFSWETSHRDSGSRWSHAQVLDFMSGKYQKPANKLYFLVQNLRKAFEPVDDVVVVKNYNHW